MEEFFYISHNLTGEDHDGCVILSYELMMEAEHRYRIKWGGKLDAAAPHHMLAPPHHAILRHWNVWPGLNQKARHWSTWCGRFMMDFYHPGPHRNLWALNPTIRWLGTLTAKIFRGLQIQCSARTSAQFDKPPTPRLWSIVYRPHESEIARKTEAMDTASPKTEGTGEGAVGGEQHTDPDKYPMSWMRDHQHWYDDEMIEFLALLRPLMDGKGTITWQLACHLLLTWHWSLVTHPTSCSPAPTNMEIGWWLSLDQEGSREDLWTEAYMHSLQCMAEAATGWSWMTEGGGMVPQVSPLVQAFLTATGRRVSPCILCECWPPEHNIIPRGTLVPYKQVLWKIKL